MATTNFDATAKWVDTPEPSASKTDQRETKHVSNTSNSYHSGQTSRGVDEVHHEEVANDLVSGDFHHLGHQIKLSTVFHLQSTPLCTIELTSIHFIYDLFPEDDIQYLSNHSDLSFPYPSHMGCCWGINSHLISFCRR